MGKLIIFGAGRNGYDAYDFFGKDNIECYVDNFNYDTLIYDKRVISFSDFLLLKEECGNYFDEKYEIVISVSITLWSMFRIASQLIKSGIESFNIYKDIRKRWKSGEDFINRNREIFPQEYESFLEIYRVQREYLFRHIRACDLLPATGKLRNEQMDQLKRVGTFLDYLSENNIDVSLFMISGTLLGSIRHKGFIPWDDDTDFGIIFSELQEIINYFDNYNSVFRHIGNNIWLNKENKKSISLEKKYLCAYGFGYIQIYENIVEDYIKDNKFITDIIPVYYFRDDYNEDDYAKQLVETINERNHNYMSVDENYFKFMIEHQNISIKPTSKVGMGHDWASFITTQIGINGRKFDKKLWNIETLFPLSKLKFEDMMLNAPCNPIEWLEKEGYDDIWALPDRVGVCVHDKDRIFKEKY